MAVGCSAGCGMFRWLWDAPAALIGEMQAFQNVFADVQPWRICPSSVGVVNGGGRGMGGGIVGGRQYGVYVGVSRGHRWGRRRASGSTFL